MLFSMPIVKKIHWPELVLIVCLSFGAFLRLWNFPNSLQFLGDQGRDAIVAKRILIDHDLALIGPVTSTGNMYLGPLYYYFMVPFLAASYPSPIGPAYAIAGLSILTIALVYFLGKEMVGEKPALIAMVMTTFASTFVYFARFSWNPNPSPLVSLILVWSIFRAYTKNPKYWILTGLCLAILVQLHYITLLCIPAAGLIWLYQAKNHIKNWKPFWFSTVLAILIFVFSFTPLVIFDFRHHFINSQSFAHFMTADLGPNQSAFTDRVRLIGTRVFLRANQTLFQEFVFPNILVSTAFTVGLIATSIMYWKKQKTKPVGFTILAIFLIISILGLGYYRGAIFNHYFIYLLPLSMLLWGVAINFISSFKVGKIAIVLFMFLFFGWNLSQYSINKTNWSIAQLQGVSSTILTRLQPNEKYNIVLLSDTGDIEGQNYRYFLEVSSHPPLRQENWGTVDTLFIINEDHKLKKVVDSPIYEIVVFPNKHPAEVYTIPGGPEITVLRR